jgi:DNA polymerase
MTKRSVSAHQPLLDNQITERQEPSLEIAGDGSIEQIRTQAANCRRCPLYKSATQTVFGEGAPDARIVLVGEQPGDQEDLAGHPFVGPAGQLLNKALRAAGIDRTAVYVTNAVKHFKHEPRGKRRIHKKPNAGEIQACRWWLDRELAVIRPRIVAALGSTAAGVLAKRSVAVTRERGPVSFGSLPGYVTIHPSYLLRIPDSRNAREEYEAFVEDLRSIRSLSASS